MFIVLPLDLIELIVDVLALEDTKSVKALSLVCRALLPHCRRNLFKTISVPKHHLRKRTAKGLWELIRESPDLGRHIRRINYVFDDEYLTDEKIPVVSQQLTRLRYLHLTHCNRLSNVSWNTTPHRHALLSLLHLPALTHLELSSIRNFLLSDLIPCINLTHLELRWVHFGKDQPADLSMALHKPMMIERFSLIPKDPRFLQALSNAKRADGKPIVDLTGIKILGIWFCGNQKLGETVKVIENWQQLVEVEIYVSGDAPRWDGLYDALKGSLETWRYLKLSTPIGSFGEDPMPSLSHELEQFRYQNLIENIEIAIAARLPSVADRVAKWSTLDRTLSGAGWPTLKYVSLEIQMFGRDAQGDGALLDLRDIYFARLASKSTIHLEFKIRTLPSN